MPDVEIASRIRRVSNGPQPAVNQPAARYYGIPKDRGLPGEYMEHARKMMEPVNFRIRKLVEETGNNDRALEGVVFRVYDLGADGTITCEVV